MENEPEKSVEYINHSRLILDNRQNPRLPRKFEGADASAILQYMIDEGNVLPLIQSIGEKGFFPGEPLLVIPASENDHFVVVEGNRRLSAVMLLHDPTLAQSKQASIVAASQDAKQKPDNLPVLIFDRRDDILEYLGFRHITGIKEWGALEKAKYLCQLYERSQAATPTEKCRELARIIGSTPNYVRKLLCALSVYRKVEDNGFYDLTESEIDKVSFSLISTAFGYSNLQTFIGLSSGEDIDPQNINGENLKDFTHWLFQKHGKDTRLGESRNLSMLSDVVANPLALEKFQGGAKLEDAWYLSGGAKDTVLKAISDSLKYLQTAYEHAAGIELDDEERGKLNEIIKVAKAVKKQVTPDDDD